MRHAGIDLAFLEKRVMDLFDTSPGDFYLPGRQKKLVEARSLLCFWAVRELGISMTAVAPRFSLTDVAIGYAVARGQKIAREKGYVMVEG